jgi:hypothetical protein
MRRVVAAGALALFAAAGPARADDEARLRALEAEVAAEREAREHPSVRVSGFVQVDWIAHNQSSQNEINDSNGALLNQDRFTLRRGHARVDADQGVVFGSLEIDANTTNGPQVRPIDAEVSLRWPPKADPAIPDLVLTAGLLRTPFGYEVQELDWVRPFLERAIVAQALFPGEFDLGVRLKARYRFADASIAAMNGSPIGAREFPDLDPVHQKDVVGRVGITADVVTNVVRLEAGVSGDAGTGFHRGTPTTKNTVVWQDANGDGVVQPTEITAIPGSAATPSSTFGRFAVGADARVTVAVPVLGSLALRAEIMSAVNMDRGLEPADPVATGRDLREIGFSIGASQELTRWGMIGVRYDRYDPDVDANQQRGVRLVPASRAYSTLALMAMVRYGAQRLVVEYDVNSNPLGISPDGAPNTLASDALTVRAQLVF